jgi:hypothetical protein
VAEWLANFHGLPPKDVKPYLYLLPQQLAANHAFRVASGLDSMVLGETQILGQMKQAAEKAHDAGTLGLLLNKLFQRTFSVAKEVRTATEIGSSTVSMSAAAVTLAERIFPSISDQAVLFIGAGEMIELVATHFAARNPRRLMVVNRTIERARDLANKFGGEAAALTNLPELLPEFDILVTSTASPLPIVGLGLVERAVKARKHRPMFMVDLAVPRDIETEVGELDDVFLYTVDDLGEVVRAGQDSRAVRRDPGRGHHRRPGQRVHALDGHAPGRAGDPQPARPRRTPAPPRNGKGPQGPAQGRRPASRAGSPEPGPHEQAAARPQPRPQLRRRKRTRGTGPAGLPALQPARRLGAALAAIATVDRGQGRSYNTFP